MSTDTFLHQLMTLPTVTHALLSPDGRRVAFMWYRIHENFDVFVVPTDGSQPPVALTHTKEATNLISWTPILQAVIVSEDHDGDEFASLFRVEIDKPLVMQPLTPDRPPYFLRGGKLHPNAALAVLRCELRLQQRRDHRAVLDPPPQPADGRDHHPLPPIAARLSPSST